jgi:hypothetical protein
VQTTPLGTSSELADQALANLVNQFARPLDFLRELVQNAIDAGTPRIEVWLRREGDVLEIHVDDFGDGMDEAIIDNQLTRLFSSTKENDLTKIGKFGIGFTSIFAIGPDAVLLHTGRHGEYWELLFHADRSFDKVRVDTPVEGTKITLYKRMEPDEMPAFVREARWVLTYWCEHSGIPITFADRTRTESNPADTSDDAFAAFEDPKVAMPVSEVVNGPFALTADLRVEHRVDDVHVLVGYTPAPIYGFYNGGLTLVNTRNPEVLGEWADRLGHLSFKVRCDALEHTLTRDNVLRDAHWAAVMEAIEAAAVSLRQSLIQRVEQAVAQDQDASLWQQYLADECRGSNLHQDDSSFADRLLVRDTTGQVRSLEAVRAQAEDLDAVVFASGQSDLDQALAAEGLLLLPDFAGTRSLIRAVVPKSGFGPFRQTLEPTLASVLFVLPQILDPHAMSETEVRLLVGVRQLFRKAVGRRIKIELGDFGGPEPGRRQPLFVEGPSDGRVFQRPDGRGFPLPSRIRWRCMLLNRHHDYFQFQLAASIDDFALACFSLAQVLLTDEGAEGERTLSRLATAAIEALL